MESKQNNTMTNNKYGLRRNTDAIPQQTGGSHYLKPIQPIEYIEANQLPFSEGCVVKYVTRHPDKKGLEDVQKAMDYLQFIALRYGNKQGYVTVDELTAFDNLVTKIKQSDKYYDKLVSSGRGGLWVLANLGYALNISDVQVMPLPQVNKLSADGILFVDDICDSGNTIANIDIDTAVLFAFKHSKVQPTYTGSVTVDDTYIHLPVSQFAEGEEYACNK